MSIKIYCIKSLALKSPKLTSQCAEVFTQTSSAFCICTKHSRRLPPKPPSDFINQCFIPKTKIFLSNTGTAKICPLRLLPCVPVPATPLPAGRPLAHLCSVPRCQRRSLQNETSSAVPQVSLHQGPNPSNLSGSRRLYRIKSYM